MRDLGLKSLGLHKARAAGSIPVPDTAWILPGGTTLEAVLIDPAALAGIQVAMLKGSTAHVPALIGMDALAGIHYAALAGNTAVAPALIGHAVLAGINTDVLAGSTLHETHLATLL